MGIYQASSWVALVCTTGIILGAAYMLYLYRRVIFGQLTKENLKNIADLTPREIVVFAPLLILVFWMGIYPETFMSPMHASVDNLLERYHTAIAAHQGATAIAAR